MTRRRARELAAQEAATRHRIADTGEATGRGARLSIADLQAASAARLGAGEASSAPAHDEQVDAAAPAVTESPVAEEPVTMTEPVTPTSTPVAPEQAPPAELPTPSDADDDVENDADQAGADPSPSTEQVDEFEHAARLFSFTGETTVIADEKTQPAGEDEDHASSRTHARAHSTRGRGTSKKAGTRPRRHAAPSARPHAEERRRTHTHRFGRVAAASLSVSAVAAIGLLAVGLTTPPGVISADAQTGQSAPVSSGGVSAAADDEIQAYVSPGDGAPTADLDRDSTFTTASLVEMAGTVGIRNVSDKYYTNDPTCDVQYPFAVGVPISFGFGPRPGEFHEGVDFTPGYGAHVQAIADGTVRIATESGGGYGVTVVIDHQIDGQHWASRYGHMQYGSLQVHPGEKVRVGQYLGRTGDTGFSFGAHTHLEILKNGTTPIDPMPWLREHATC